ncbi:MAG: hypothetical protein Q4B50_06360, partial [Bacillota bacterium]|nr:hypothetical protein [Bacillota bacterium]
MKNKIWSIFLAFFLLLSLAAPAGAALDYGLIYDETELIWTEELAKLGEETMPGFVEKYGIDVRVDILTTAGEYETLYDAAENIYSNYAYGGPGGNGVSLTLLVNQDEENVSMDGWCLYFGGESAEWTVN